MNCKDCYHHDVCAGVDVTQTECEHFKDKSKIIELRFKKGDEIYWIEAPKIASGVVRQHGGEENDLWYIVNKGKGKKIVVINNNRCYATKEEAEQRLEELTSGNYTNNI